MSKDLQPSFTFIAEHPSLDFANTVRWHASDHQLETLTDYEELIRWAQAAGILEKAQFRMLREKAAQSPDEAREVLDRAKRLREAIYQLCTAVIHEKTPPKAALGTLNDEISTWISRARVVSTTGGFRWNYDVDPIALESVLWPIIRNSAELLTSEQIHRVGQCADDRGCGWLFLDKSKNHSRRWCDINDCGNRAKQRRYQKRQSKKKGS
jgi:predicted RNA-binding Zn ribbon-like protein